MEMNAYAGLSIILFWLLLFVWVGLVCKNINPLNEIKAFLKKQSTSGRIVFLLFFLVMTIYGGTKPTDVSSTNDVNNVSGSTNMSADASLGQLHTGQIDSSSNSPLSDNVANSSEQLDIPSSFTNEDFERGFVLTRVATDEVFDFSAPANAVVCEDWRAFGAATDWMYISMTNWAFNVGTNYIDSLRVFSFGKVEPYVFEEEAGAATNYWFAPFVAKLGIVPEANEELLLESSNPSQVWYQITPQDSLIITWQNALLDRDVNKPVSFQVEFNPDGLFTYRYDFSRLDTSSITNIIAGASFAGNTWATNTLSSSVTSMTFYQLTEDDFVYLDPDGDGIVTSFEVLVLGTNPKQKDSDYDGIKDGDEISLGSNPISRDSDGDGLVDGSDNNPLIPTPFVDEDNDGVNDVYENHWFKGTNIVESLEEHCNNHFSLGFNLTSGYNPTNGVETAFMATNRVAALKIADGFIAETTTITSNLYERTFNISRTGSWEQYYISSKPNTAGDWKLDGVILEWEDSEGEKGSVTASPFNDSYYIPVSTNSPAYLTIRLVQTKNEVSCYTPLYLLNYSPDIEIESARKVNTGASQWEVVNITEESTIDLKIDRKERPCNAPLYKEETNAVFVGDEQFMQIKSSDEAIDVTATGIYPLPSIDLVKLSKPVVQTRMLKSASPNSSSSVGERYLVCLNPTLIYGGGHHLNEYGLVYNYVTKEYLEKFEYPLDSDWLWRSWYIDPTKVHTCNCEPTLQLSADIDDYPEISTNLVYDVEVATGYLSIGNVIIWSDTATHRTVGYPTIVKNYLSDDVDDSCKSCETGYCDDFEGGGLGSVKFRIPLGFPNEGIISGFAWFLTDSPMLVGLDTLQLLARDDADISDITNNGIRTIACFDRNGRTLTIQEIPNGIEVVIKETSTGKLEHTWHIVNENGDPSTIRLTKISRLNNLMSDDTYSYAKNNSYSGEWSKYDNIAKSHEYSYCENFLNENGEKTEYKYISDEDGKLLSVTETRSKRFGSFDNAVLRETYHGELSWNDNIKESFASYYTDGVNPFRNGTLRLEWGNNRDWCFYAYDTEGRLVLTLEQYDGSECPIEELNSYDADYFDNINIENWVKSQWISANATIYDYTPLDGDDSNNNDAFNPRTVSRYNGRTLIGRTWYKYTHGSHDGLATITAETITAGAQNAKISDARNSISIETSFDGVAGEMPLPLVGKPISSIDTDGITTSYSYSIGNGVLTTTKQISKDGVLAKTKTITESCATYGNTLREWNVHLDSGLSFDETSYLYDSKNRLVSTIYSDGTYSTNAYSCCRLLYTIDRSGRKTLRSAVTGQDHFYYAYEEVSIADLPKDERYISYDREPNGAYKVTQHFFDALGREINTITRTCASPGAATNTTWNCLGWSSSKSTSYPYGVSDYAISTDSRGVETITSRFYADDYEETLTIETNKTSLTTTWRNGNTIIYEQWDENKWKETATYTQYDNNGCRSERVSIDTSDYHSIDTSVTYYDFLGRTIRRRTPTSDVYYTYDGSSSRVLTMTNQTTGQVVTKHYDELGDEIGQSTDNVTALNETDYEIISNVLWRVTSQISFGSVTNSNYVVKHRVSNLSNNICEESIMYNDGVLINHTVTSLDPVSYIQTVVSSSPIKGQTISKYKYGVLIEEIAPEGTIANNFFDPYGRVFYREIDGRSIDWIGRNDYGDTIEYDIFHSFDNVYAEFYEYDKLGNRISLINALGIVTTSLYDEANRIKEVAGGTYPVRYGYDTYGRMTELSTTRDGVEWDITQWEFDEDLGLCTTKTYADGSKTRFTYTQSGEPLKTTYASGRWNENIYNAKREIEKIHYSDGEIVTYSYDEFSRVIQVSNDVSTISFIRTNNGLVTNEVTSVGHEQKSFTRNFDEYKRLTNNDGLFFDYDCNGSLVFISNAIASVQYKYATDLLDLGYIIRLPNGIEIERYISRDPYRRSLITYITNKVNGSPIDEFAFTYDPLNRIVNRNNDSFGYNNRNEVTSALIADFATQYGYDNIGNSTNWLANCLNQYNPFTYDVDGNILSDGVYSYTYDAAQRLSTVSSNGVLLVTNQYNGQSRRVRKITPQATTTYFYDGWNLVEERITYTDGSRSTIKYYWGKDLSGTLQGAGGIGGLLFLTIDDELYIPTYDNNGNIIRYLDSNGNTVTQYTYDAFGKTIAQAGILANIFRHRYSTKYFDNETSLYYYGYRFYHPTLMRWLNRDPIEEDGGINLYAFCGNNTFKSIDYLGLSADWHHLLPKQFEEKFRNAGFDINSSKYGIILDKHDHTGIGGIHPKWNQEWQRFFDRHPNPTRGQIVQKLYSMKNDPLFKPILDNGVKAKLDYKSWRSATKTFREIETNKVSKKIMKKNSKKVLEGGSKKIIKRVPVVGLVFIYSDINDKGVVNGVCNNLLDACPILGWVKFGTECFWGDWLPDKDE